MAKYKVGDREVYVPEPGSATQNPGSAVIDPIDEARTLTKKMIADDMIGAEAAKVRAERAKAEAEAREAEARARRLDTGEVEQGKGGFKLTGGVNLGNIDLQKEREEATVELRRLKKEADDAATAVGRENQELREKIHQQEMKVLEIGLKTQLEQMSKMIENNANRGSFMEQYHSMMENIKLLGFDKPSSAADLNTQIQLKKMEFDQAKELRRLAREERAEERRWKVELMRLDDERDERRRKAEQESKRDDMVSRAPEMIGRAIAQGIMTTSEGKSSVSEQPITSRKDGTAHHVEAGPGEAGEVECPGCGQPVAIAPTAGSAVCANCGSKYSIDRTSAQKEE